MCQGLFLCAYSPSRKIKINQAADSSTKFLIMYWPVSVRAKKDCQVSSTRNKTGKKVVNKWAIITQKAILVNFGDNHSIPIAHSPIPKINRNVSIPMKGSSVI